MYSNRGWSYSSRRAGSRRAYRTRGAARRRPFGLPRLMLPRLRLARPVVPHLSVPRVRLSGPRVPLPRLRLPRLVAPAWLRLPRFSPLPVAVLVVAALAWYHLVFAGFSTRGTVVDEATGAPVSGARLWSPRTSTVADADGAFVLPGVKPADVIGLDAPGYRGSSLRIGNPFDGLAAHLHPVRVDISTVDSDSGQPVPAVVDGGIPATTMGPGWLEVSAVRPGQHFKLQADGYAPAETTFTRQEVLRVALQPKLSGRVTDAATGRGVGRARVLAGSTLVLADSDGDYELRHRPPGGQLVVLAPGYRAGRVDLTQQGSLDVQLQPNEVHGMYMTYFAIGGDDYRQQMYQLLDTTELNAVVIDVKGDYGLLSYKSNVPLAHTIGADSEPTIDDLDGLLRTLHQHGTYVIARIVVFKDNMLARNGPRAGLDVGVKDRRTGELWLDGEKLAWVDPFQSAAWDYNTDLAREAIQRGFDEVQFDYIRFPTDPSPNSSINDITYSQPLTEENRVAALKSFLHRAHNAVNDAGGYLGMDTFGYTTWWTDDGGIGQDLSVLADDIDYYCPMVYPSTFNAGLPGLIPYPEVVSRPYDVVFRSLRNVQQKLEGKNVVVRPWLQYFDDYPWAQSIRYDAPQIEAQKKAVVDSKSFGWMFWNAGSLYRRGGFAAK
jgi:hypothetical protein